MSPQFWLGLPNRALQRATSDRPRQMDMDCLIDVVDIALDDTRAYPSKGNSE